MPKVSERYREARRDEIAQAALRCLERNGVRDTSIADIVAESGLSTGAIYSHFRNKAELARYIVGRFLSVRIDVL
ncbi:MAG: TetR family transcriptional regulator, partial [Microbacterium sp.]|nr:TetR family transcriptional regulator [Microbacterium sp.]